ncbi:MAG TPA: cyclic nucleotide-binding domain-containing protein [Caldimonas sp.]
MPETRIELLQGMPIFGAIREDTLRYLLEQTRSVSRRAQEFFFREGDRASGIFVLETGRARVIKEWRGRQLLRKQLGPGDCFGEMALMDLLPRSASVQASDDCTAIEITPDHLYRLFERDAEQFVLIQMNMGREVSRRLRATDEQLFRAEMAAARGPDESR